MLKYISFPFVIKYNYTAKIDQKRKKNFKYLIYVLFD